MSDKHTITVIRDKDGFQHSTRKIECLASAGADCRVGCPVPDCEDWFHNGVGISSCEHCVNECYCLCSYCTCETQDIPHCPPCAIAQEHGETCPHIHRDLGYCWLCQEMEDWDGWIYDFDIIRTYPFAPSQDGTETWRVTYDSYFWDYDHYVFGDPTEAPDDIVRLDNVS